MALHHRPRALALALPLLAVLTLSAPAVAQDKAPPSWEEIDRLTEEKKLETAVQGVEARLAQARSKADEDEWARALIRTVQLRTELHGHETAVRFLREQPWPKGLLPRTGLQLFYAQSLVTYTRSYTHEINQREHVAAVGPVDLKAWTYEQLITEAHRAFAEVWKDREQLGRVPVQSLSEYILPNSYPEGIRSTLRDAVSYLWVSLLANTVAWRPAHSQELYKLDLRVLLKGTPKVDLTDPAVHPLLKMASLLGDLEAWHRAAGHREAELEARLERYTRLHHALEKDDDRARLRQHLASHLEGFRQVPWWAVGQGLLADLELSAGNRIRAHEVAKACAAAYPESESGLRCAEQVSSLEEPSYSVRAMYSDGLGRRSIEVTHRNVPTLYFRAYAYAYDLEKQLAKGGDAALRPDDTELRRIVTDDKPVATWSTALPATTDYRDHRTFVTPPLTQPGLYVILTSEHEDFQKKANHAYAVLMTVTSLAAFTRTDDVRRVEVRVVDGETGRPVPGVEVRLFATHSLPAHKESQPGRTDERGAVTLSGHPKSAGPYTVVVGRGREALVLPSQVALDPRSIPSPEVQTLVFTDRSVYRPLQKISWKVVAFSGSWEQARYTAQPNTTVTVSLEDPNGQVVEKREVRTNAFGSAVGEFTVPAGRVLGRWRVSTPSTAGAAIRVEEYKRPTFEVTLNDPESPLRLNRPATFRGEARYYFGLPVVNGLVRWRAYREPVFPGWWWHGDGSRAERQGRQVVAQGTAPLAKDGSFGVTFTPEADEREAKSKELTWRYRVEVDATDEGGETRSASRAFRVGIVAVEARVELDTGFLTEGTPAELRLVRSTLDGVPQAGKGTWRLVALQQPARPVLPADEPLPSPSSGQKGEERITTPGDGLRPRWSTESSLENTLRGWAAGAEQARGTAEHDAQGLARVKLPALKPGAWRLQYETVDAFGQAFTTAHEFLVAGSSPPAMLPAALLLERTTVKVGEKVRLLAFSGFEGQPLFLELCQGERRLQRRVLTQGQDPAVVELPVTEEMRGGFSVALTGVRDYQVLHFVQPVSVPFDDKELKLEFTTFRDRLRPGSKETWRVTVKGPRGAKVEAGAAELLAYMYDQSLDLFAPHTPPAVSALYPSRARGVDLRRSVGEAVAHGYRITPFEPQEFLQVQERLKAQAPWLAPDADELRFDRNYSIGGPRRTDRYVSRRRQSNGYGEAEPPEPSRWNFAETAFWLPQLLTGEDGSATLEFTVPDSTTAWSAWVHAVTRDLKGGSVQRTARTVKELMVRPYVPRFLREGDQAVLEVGVHNASEQKQQGTLTLDILDPQTEKSVLSRFGVTAASQAFTVEPGKGTSLRFALVTPPKVGTVAFRVSATAGSLGDGELRPVPVLPGRMHLAQSRFVTLRGKDRKVMTFEDPRRNDDRSLIHEQLVVTVDTQLFYSALQALPYLVDSPYECTEQMLNRFVSTGIVSSLYGQYPAVAKMAKMLDTRPTRSEAWDATDPNRKMALEETPWLQEAQGGRQPERGLVRVLDPKIAKAERDASLAMLREAQTSSGGFPWWPGGPPSPYMTLYIAHGLARASEYKVEYPREMTQRAWDYLAQHFRAEYVGKLMKEDRGWEFLTFLNYVASSYPDASDMGEALTREERARILDFSFKHWKEHSAYLKGYLALTLKRAGRVKDAERVWESVMDSAKTSPELGTYWAPEDRSWLWYNDTTETHAFALRTLMELKPKDPRRDGLVQWLLLNRKLTHWKSTRATAEALYALVKYLEQEGALSHREDAKVTVGDKAVEFAFEPDTYTGKRNQVVVSGPEVEPARSSTVVVEKTAKGFAFASATWHFSTEKLPAEDRGDFFQVSRRYFLRVHQGREAVLRPLEEGAKLVPGDEVEVQLSLRTKHAAEYVHLRDPRAAGLEPASAVSRHKWNLGIAWYEETRDSGTNFFFERLPMGEYTFKYRLRANMAGTFRVGPATVQSLYAPEFTAYSEGAVLTVGNAIHPAADGARAER